jgi:hypothetical protein
MLLAGENLSKSLNSEEYMAQHDGGDRAAYLQEMENSDPSFYVPPVN